MGSLGLVFEALSVYIGQFLALCSSRWFLTVLIFLMVLDLVVGVIISLRGTGGR